MLMQRSLRTTRKKKRPLTPMAATFVRPAPTKMVRTGTGAADAADAAVAASGQNAAIAMIGRVSHSRHRSPRLHRPAPRRTMPGTMRMTPRPKAPTVPLFSTRMASPAVAAAVAAVAAVAIAVKMARA